MINYNTRKSRIRRSKLKLAQVLEFTVEQLQQDPEIVRRMEESPESREQCLKDIDRFCQYFFKEMLKILVK